MSNQRECRFCQRSDPKRENDSKIRCPYRHEWVDPHGVCNDYHEENPFHVDMLKQIEMFEHQRRKRGI